MTNGSLERIMQWLFDQAAAHPGQPQRRILTHGLRVDVLIDNGRTAMQISRDSAPGPSDEEWRTAVRLSPGPIPSVTPRALKAEDRYFLKAEWETIDERQTTLFEVEHE